MGAGMEDKIIKQISLFAENKPGRLANVANKLKSAGINIRHLPLPSPETSE